MVSKGLLKVTVRQRIEGFLMSGDSQDLLTQKTARDAGRLKRSATGFRQGRVVVLDAEGVHLVAMLYWCRGCMPSNPVAEAEIAAAEKLFRLLSPGAADPVPRVVRELRRQLRREAAETALGMLATAEAQADAGLADQALEVLRGTLESAPTGDADIPDLLHRFSLAHRVRFCILGHADDNTRAIELARAAVQRGGAEHHERLANLAGLLQNRYTLLGNPGDLDESVALSREGLDAEGDAGLILHGAALCGALLLRHQNSGAERDLNEAIELGRTVLAHCAPDAPKRAEVESFLARSLLARHWRTRCPDDLEEALSLSRAAVRDAPTGSTFRTLMMGNLAGVLRDRFGVTGVRADLDEAIGIMGTVLRDVPEEHADFAVQLGNSGVYHRVRYEQGGDPADLDTALPNIEPITTSKAGAPRRTVESLLTTNRQRSPATSRPHRRAAPTPGTGCWSPTRRSPSEAAPPLSLPAALSHDRGRSPRDRPRTIEVPLHSSRPAKPGPGVERSEL
ncbi:tetratricopeptide repeat protein [Streptomyces collinus]|uniref:Tetratricopeptide repeat protein n=1 Tax=Streptomyces collinus (strain DSM 40733 / Tue 365) TaxID=1214242 RepID=S5VEN0_STRC3|nr:hypothetical protein [Streptomyces collinus]AGS66880.1 hypothetical protein B446_00190 [Streptomyces collinus Tu 365]AGS73814.1 hypothetical protein B446_35100 [Streptomyces collinus Tu 365]